MAEGMGLISNLLQVKSLFDINNILGDMAVQVQQITLKQRQLLVYEYAP